MGMRLGGNKRQTQFDEYMAARRRLEDIHYCDCIDGYRWPYTSKHGITGKPLRNMCGHCGKEIDPKEMPLKEK